jgi:glutaredoxin
MAHDVFISYAAEDRSAAEAARAALEAQGVSCWIAPRDVLPGKEETESILAAIDASNVVVLCLSAAANASKLVTQQAARAFNKSIPIVPLRVEDVAPSDALRLFFGKQEGVDAYVPPLEGQLQRLAEIVAVLVTRPRQKKQEAVSDVVSASAADGELAWLEPWALAKGGKLEKTAPPEAEGYRPARRKDQLGGKRSAAPVLLVAGVLIIGIVIAAALASNVSPSELIPSFLKQAKQLQGQIETPSATPKSKASLTVLYFQRPDCSHCVELEKTASFQQLQKKATVQSVRTDQSPTTLTNQYGVTEVPTLILLNNGKEVGRWVGPTDVSAINAQIDSMREAG